MPPLNLTGQGGAPYSTQTNANGNASAASSGGNMHKVTDAHIQYLNTPPTTSNLKGVAVPGDLYWSLDSGTHYVGQLDGSLRDLKGQQPIFPIKDSFVASFIPGHAQYVDPETLDWEGHGGEFIWSGTAGSKIAQNSIFTLRETSTGLQIEKALNSWAYHLRARKTAFAFGSGKTLEFIYRTQSNVSYAMIGAGNVMKPIGEFMNWTDFDGGQYHYQNAIRDWRHGNGSGGVHQIPDLTVPPNQSVKSVFPEGGSSGLTNHNSLVAGTGPDLFAASEETGSPLDYVCQDSGKSPLICFHIEPVYTGVGRHFTIQGIKVS